MKSYRFPAENAFTLTGLIKNYIISDYKSKPKSITQSESSGIDCLSVIQK
jgi:hypothetical protein